MKWQRGRKTGLLIDRRGERPPAGFPGRRRRRRAGVSGALIVALFVGYVAIRVFTGDSVGGRGGAASPAPQKRSGPAGGGTGAGGSSAGNSAADAELTDFLAFLIEDTNGVWAKKLPGGSFKPAPMVVFEGSTRSACGTLNARIGPAYCPADQRMYVPPSFYRLLRDRLGAPGDFAQAIVVAHEMGHHVQRRMGITQTVQARIRKDRSQKRDLKIRQELQADCFAGIWAHSTRERKLLERGDVEEALRAAASIGDDALQQQAGRKVDPAKFSHGSSAQRVRWFQKGLASGQLSDCDTFAATAL